VAGGRPARDAVFLRALGQAVREERDRRGWKQPELAHRAGISRNFLSSLENGRHGVDVRRLLWLADALEVPLTGLLAAALAALVAATGDATRAGQPEDDGRSVDRFS
jgi:transcriptional regulator with XRE-family HTH domain